MNGLERIRRFSLVTWILGSVVVAVIAFVVFPQIAVNPRTGQIQVGGDGEYADGPRPWQVADPQEYEIVDGELHGTAAGGFLRLPAGSPLMQFTGGPGVEDADWVDVSQQPGTQTDTEADDWEYPRYIGSLHPDVELLVLSSADEDGLLWFSPSEADWTVTVTEPEVTPMGESASGSGNAVLMYEGDALSGRFQHTGTGVFLVGAVTVGDWESLVNEVDEVDVRASWKPTDRVVFQVEADTGEGSWTITLDTPAGTAPEPTATGDPPTDPTPEPTP